MSESSHPPRASHLLLWTLCGLACATRPSDETDARPAPTASNITMHRLRAEVDRHICAEWSPEAQAWGGPLFDDPCPRPTADTELARAAQGAVIRMRPMLMLSEAAGERFEAAVHGQPGSAQTTADTRARAAFWGDPVLSRAVALALQSELDARGWRCEDCPPMTPPPPLALRWSTFLPYLNAYIWPHDGQHTPVEIHVCSGINGAGALPPDPRLRHAGVLTAFAFVIDETMATQIRRIGEASTSVPDAAAALHALLDAPPGRAHACTALANLEWFTGLRIDECPRRPERPPPR